MYTEHVYACITRQQIVYSTVGCLAADLLNNGLPPAHVGSVDIASVQYGYHLGTKSTVLVHLPSCCWIISVPTCLAPTSCVGIGQVYYPYFVVLSVSCVLFLCKLISVCCQLCLLSTCSGHFYITCKQNLYINITQWPVVKGTLLCLICLCKGMKLHFILLSFGYLICLGKQTHCWSCNLLKIVSYFLLVCSIAIQTGM